MPQCDPEIFQSEACWDHKHKRIKHVVLMFKRINKNTEDRRDNNVNYTKQQNPSGKAQSSILNGIWEYD